MAHGVNSVLKRGPSTLGCKNECKTGIGSRRIFAPHFKLQVLDSYRNDADCKGNQRATARKYGIHRRQIQKWLQVENNLRNSVSKTKSGEPTVIPEARKCGIELALRSVGHRQRDDLGTDAYSQSSGGTEARVPALSPVAYNKSGETTTTWPTDTNSNNVLQLLPSGPVPLDFTTHSRGHQSSSPTVVSPAPVDPAAPMDLSLKKPTPTTTGDFNAAPVLCCTNSLTPPRPSSVTQLNQLHPDVWDLSTKGIKRKCEDNSYPTNSNSSLSRNTPPKTVKLFKPYLDDLHDNSNSSEEYQMKTPEVTPPCCSNNNLIFLPNCENYYYNNNICDINTDYHYTLHDLQPKHSVDYFCSVTKTYMYRTPDCCSSPYEEAGLLHTLPPLKQRQSYSLDFKLSAIECYYQDSLCRGNQRAVANKYNIHRRQVQKWLQQEDELRQRNETIKQMHAVR